MKITNPQFLRGLSTIFTAAKTQPISTISLALKVITTRNSPVAPNARAEVKPFSAQTNLPPTLAMKQSVAVVQNPATAGENRPGAEKNNLSTPAAAPLMPHRPAPPVPEMSMRLGELLKGFEQNQTAVRQKAYLQYFGSMVNAAQNNWLPIASGDNGVQK